MTKRLSLVLHCGANLAAREQVEQVVSPEPTDTWHPIPHRSLIDMVHDGLPKHGLRIVNESHALYKGGDRYFGLFQVDAAIGGDGTPNEAAQDFGLVFGLRNSHDKTFPAGLALGSGVFVCDNLAFSAEVVICRRHTKHIMRDLPTLVAAAVGKLVQASVDQSQRLEIYKNTELSNEGAAELLLNAMDAGAINTTRVPKVWEQWKTPNHPEFAERNVWRFFNGVTEVLKDSSLTELPNRTTRLHGLLDARCGLVIDAKASIREELSAVGATDFEMN
jgi:hypothetical protein